jgi:pyruvate/2-oxoglutarate dehydrogenase complex dihydrolipoamide dehydrogenase (E3) component
LCAGEIGCRDRHLQMRIVNKGGVSYEVGVAYYRDIARGQIGGDTTGRLKLIFHRETRVILGIHIIGEGLRS